MLPPPPNYLMYFLESLVDLSLKWMNRFCIIISCLESERKLWNQELVNLLIASQTFSLDFDTTEPDQIDLQNRIFLCEFKTKNAGVRMCLLQSCQFDRKLFHSALLPLWWINIPSIFELVPGWPLSEIRTIKSTKNPFKHCYVDCFCQLLAEDTCAKTSSKSCWDEYLRLGSAQFIQMTMIL